MVDGVPMEIECFDTRIALGRKVEEDTVTALMEEETIETAIRDAIEKIKTIRSGYDLIEKNINYYYEVGGVLQFIDKKGFGKRYGNRANIFTRMAVDLEPDLLFGKPKIKKAKAKPQREAARVIERMYRLGKFKKNDLSRASWNQWEEILKFKGLADKRRVLQKVFQLCLKGLTSVTLRKEIKKHLRG